MRIRHHFFCKGNVEINGLTNVSGVISKAVAMFIPLPAVAFTTGTMTAEGRLAPEVIKEKINRVKNGIADKVKKENATETYDCQQGYDQNRDKKNFHDARLQ